MKVNYEMVENWLGCLLDEKRDLIELIQCLANDDYKQKDFKKDIIDNWQNGEKDE
tara:strand:- start:693 stop:857 length:165 start_codon:yes stop_codon:yes gene_type:complete